MAWDDGRKTSDAFMRAAKRNGIPCSFVVDKAGKVAYIGHPMWLDMPIEGVIAGTWDANKGKEQIAATEKKVGEVMRGLMEAPEKKKAIELQTQAVAIDGRADIKESLTEYQKALQAGAEKKAVEASGKK